MSFYASILRGLMKGKEFIRRLKAYGVVITPGRGKGGHVRASLERLGQLYPLMVATILIHNF